MNDTYDERELLTKARPSARHPARTLCCDVSENDDDVGSGLSRTMREVYGDHPLPDDKIVVHFRGKAGDGFGNGLGPGITFVADAIGKQGCSKMTGGRAVLLSLPEDEFCRGLTGGLVYVYAAGSDLPLASGAFNVAKLNPSEKEQIRALIEEHGLLTESAHAHHILENWDSAAGGFVRVTAAA